MEWPWLDVVFWARVADDAKADDEERTTLANLAAFHAPEAVLDRHEARPWESDGRTPDEIWQDVLAAEQNGWRQ